MPKPEWDKRSAIFGGATLGLIVGVVLGLFAESFGRTIIISVLVGAMLGFVAEILGKIGDRMRS